jgi:large subunit ribosomal protein L25
VAEVRIRAEQRTEFGKGGARRTRRAGLVPAVIYGHGQPPRHISLPAREIGLALRSDANVLLHLDLDGGSELALAKDVQRDPLKQSIDHIDLIVVRRGEKVRIDVPIQLVGELGNSDVLLNHDLTSITVEADATALPRGFEVDISDLEVGTTIYVRDIKVPGDVTVVTDADALVVSGLAAPTAAQLDAELAEAAAESGAGQVSGAEPSEADEGDSGEAAADSGSSAESAEQPAGA